MSRLRMKLIPAIRGHRGPGAGGAARAATRTPPRAVPASRSARARTRWQHTSLELATLAAAGDTVVAMPGTDRAESTTLDWPPVCSA